MATPSFLGYLKNWGGRKIYDTKNSSRHKRSCGVINISANFSTSCTRIGQNYGIIFFNESAFSRNISYLPSLHG